MWNRYRNWYFGKERRSGNELTGGEFNLRYIKFALSSGVQHRILEADQSPPLKTEERNEWNHTSTHFHTAVQQGSFHIEVYNTIWPIVLYCFIFVCTNLSGEFMYACKLTLPSIFNFISGTLQFFVKYEHYYSCTVRTAEKYFPYTLNITRKYRMLQRNSNLTLSSFTVTVNVNLVLVFQG